jgi:hypothetical protein
LEKVERQLGETAIEFLQRNSAKRPPLTVEAVQRILGALGSDPERLSSAQRREIVAAVVKRARVHLGTGDFEIETVFSLGVLAKIAGTLSQSLR